MRLDQLTLSPRSIVVDLKCPLAQLSVTGQMPLHYRVRGWNTYWSSPRTLEPGQNHRYEIHDPLEWQILGERGVTHTLRPGEIAHWEEDGGTTYDPPRATEKSTVAETSTSR